MKADDMAVKAGHAHSLTDESAGGDGLLDRMARRSVFALLSSLDGGSIRLEEAGASHRFGDPSLEDGIHATVVVVDSRVYRLLLLQHGSIGAGEAWMAGYWTSPDLTAVVRLFCRNLPRFRRLGGGPSRLAGRLALLRHRLSVNTLKGSRRNVHAHYDLGNGFFRTFLDGRMMYSSAVFPHPDADLDTASAHKLQLIGDRLQPAPGDSVLEIGTGWGGLAVYLAERFGCRVTTTTISKEQYVHARELVHRMGLDHLVTVLDRDYRELDGRYDRLVSVEMIEAVGHQYLPVYLARCDALLAPGGRMVLQAITIPEQRYEAARDGVDFIQRYIFPGGGLPSIESVLHAAGKHTGLQMKYLEDIGEHYALTLRHWRRRFIDNSARVRALGFDDRFMRMWQFYLQYCEGGFLERAIGAAQIVLVKA